ncbi:hypothetical protein HDU97_002708 [Phlyctochytrium planicorne]|nr:hypothetical protein HDU97_002708 [Phlyctochytrium planicorne]
MKPLSALILLLVVHLQTGIVAATPQYALERDPCHPVTHPCAPNLICTQLDVHDPTSLGICRVLLQVNDICAVNSYVKGVCAQGLSCIPDDVGTGDHRRFVVHGKCRGTSNLLVQRNGAAVGRREFRRSNEMMNANRRGELDRKDVGSGNFLYRRALRAANRKPANAADPNDQAPSPNDKPTGPVIPIIPTNDPSKMVWTAPYIPFIRIEDPEPSPTPGFAPAVNNFFDPIEGVISDDGQQIQK